MIKAIIIFALDDVIQDVGNVCKRAISETVDEFENLMLYQ